MKTIAFLGSDKNAGKTTAFNFVSQSIQAQRQRANSPFSDLCLTSIGINGELRDNYDGARKPAITLGPNTLFITTIDRLRHLVGHYEIIQLFLPPAYKRNYLLGRMLHSQEIELEGPNDYQELLALKKELIRRYPNLLLLIDGSIDRQFLARPDISDEFFFSLLLTKRPLQKNKAKQLLYPLSLPACKRELANKIRLLAGPQTKSLLFDHNERPIFHSTLIPFHDEKLVAKCRELRKESCTLYLAGALTTSLYQFLKPLHGFQIVLDNFTLYQHIQVSEDYQMESSRISLLHPVKINTIFIKQEDALPLTNFQIPANVPVMNLFREDLYEVRIKA